MKILTTCVIFFLGSVKIHCQSEKLNSKSELIISPELMLGQSTEANSDFPDRSLQIQFILGFGRSHYYNPQEWAHQLNAPTTGIKIGYTNFGNKKI